MGCYCSNYLISLLRHVCVNRPVVGLDLILDEKHSILVGLRVSGNLRETFAILT